MSGPRGNPVIDRVHHVGLVVPSADEAIGFYRDVMGLEVTADEVIEEQGVRGVLLALGENEVELLEPVVADTGVARFLESRGPTLHHICLNTDDIDAELARLKGQDVELIDETARNGLAGRVAFIHPKAMHGVLVELAQPPADAHVSHEKGFDRLGVQVASLDVAAASWQEVCGLSVETRHEVPADGLVIGEMQCSQCTIEILAPSGVDGAWAQRIEAEGERAVSAIVVEVPDITQAVAEYRARGATIGDPGPGSAPGTMVASVSAADAFGLRVELREYAR